MEGLGIDWKILLGQIVNFAILLWLLKRFVYKPFLAMLKKRQTQIEEGVKKTQEAEKSLEKIKTLADEVRRANEKRGKEIVAASEAKAQEKSKTILALADKEKTVLLDNARRAMEKERERMRETQQKETIDLAFDIVKNTLKETMTKDQDKKMIEKLAAGAKGN
jgi:F-type H+-transporting ATPase subunit b